MNILLSIIDDFSFFLFINQHWISTISLILTALGFVATLYGIYLGFNKIQMSINSSVSEFKSLARDFTSVADMNRIKGIIDEVYALIEGGSWSAARLRTSDLYERMATLRGSISFTENESINRYNAGLAKCKTLQISLSSLDKSEEIEFDIKKALKSLTNIKDLIIELEEPKNILREDTNDS